MGTRLSNGGPGEGLELFAVMFGSRGPPRERKNLSDPGPSRDSVPRVDLAGNWKVAQQ